jgi:hypothetical protein
MFLGGAFEQPTSNTAIIIRKDFNIITGVLNNMIQLAS